MADLHINLDPSSKTAVLRQLGRIQRLRMAAIKPKYVSSREKFEDEITSRTLALKALGVIVPSTDNGLVDLVSQITSSRA